MPSLTFPTLQCGSSVQAFSSEAHRSLSAHSDTQSNKDLSFLAAHLQLRPKPGSCTIGRKAERFLHMQSKGSSYGPSARDGGLLDPMKTPFKPPK
ncbi:hypothetical protein FQA47_012426 [Oryzias melastigma]|uniref:Uncharacterized protein n=1 Tax=Oryzias melastigma TaxID=30732 RepID=A0A834L1Q4_ORYME|nr:hypothetical protein FQA47_012426 [Oryzias melastigma]